MSIQHTDKCLAAQNRIAELAEAWKALWPNYCKTCKGFGEGYEEEYEPDGNIGYSFPCPDCAEKELCPRCGANGIDVWYTSDYGFKKFRITECSACGWESPHFDKNNLFTAALPEWHGCTCRMAEMMGVEKATAGAVTGPFDPNDNL